MDYSTLDAPMDDHDYPTNLAQGQIARTPIFLETIYYPTGDYTLMWDGEGNLTLETCDDTYSFDASSSKTQTITISTACESGVILTITETNPEDHIRNLRFYLPGYGADSSFWTDHYIDFHSQFGVTRFTWGSGLYSPQSEWLERSRLEDRNWRDGDEEPLINNGVPYTAMIDLANRAETDVWISTPPRATRSYQSQLATLIRDNLNSEHKVWIEWGNEYWNCGVWGYQGCAYLDEIDEQNSDPELDNPHFYAREALGLFEVFDSVFSATNERERLYTVLGGQVGNSWQLQESTNEIAQQGRMDEVDLLTIAPYYSGVDRVLPAFNRGGLDAVFPALDSVVTDLYAGIGELGEEFLSNVAIARQYNKPLVAYEGGQHLTGWIGLPPYFAADVSRDERIYDHYLQYFNNWEEIDVTATFIHYSDIAQFHEDEAFPLLENYTMSLDEAPKLRAFLDWQNEVNTRSEWSEENPSEIRLYQNYSNPFNPTTVISFQLSVSSNVTLKVFDAMGREVAILENGLRNSGVHSVNFDASALSSGIYIYRLTTDSFISTKKMLLIK